MVLKSCIFSFSILLLTACGNGSTKENEVIPNETPEEKGESLYVLNCASCHGEDGKLGSSGAKDLSVSKLNDQQIEEIIRKGKNAMPAQEAVLETDENIKLVIEHVKTLKR
ncbi:MAG: cytochrome c [Flavobacteriales bacterium]|nr:cytochrome c [Flavobacteriales bacterium]